MSKPSPSRRQFLAACSTVGVSTTLLPGVLWARMQEQAAPRVTDQMLKDALAVAGLEFPDEDRQQMLEGLNRTLDSYDALRKVSIDPQVAPPLYYSPLVPGTALDHTARPFRPSTPPKVTRPADLEDVAFWPLTHLAELLRTRQVTSTELATMYLARLERYKPTLNFVVSLTPDLAKEQAAAADREIAAGRYRGPLHGIPWGCKDIIAVPGYKTTWGSGAYVDQVIDSEATVVRLLREAGAVLVAKLTTGELAGGDRWFGGRTNNPWNPEYGSSGSSAGPASATAAGCVAFGIGSETSGSILSPSTVCGCTGLRPTFGRVSRHGAMTLSWSLDRLGPICRTAEDCAVVFKALAVPDPLDMTVQDLPFNYDAATDLRSLKVGYLKAAFDEEGRDAEWKAHDTAALDTLRGLGVTLVPFDLPEMPIEAIGGVLGVESGASFDQDLRSGRLAKMTNKGRANGMRTAHLVPAVDYLQAQRVRMMVMEQFAAAVSGFDVYLAPFMEARGSREPAGGAAPAARPSGPPPERPPSVIRDHFTVANACGYPAVAVPHGFTKEGLPTSITFLGRLYNEGAILALARAYQAKVGWPTRTPTLG
ncbi:MAG: amidase [Vicinamibacterales bacterium]